MNTGTKGKKRVEFRCSAPPGSRVFVAGSFNGWDPGALPLREQESAGLFSRTVYLPKGRHEYQFVVDGQWNPDPACPETCPNPFGSLNSLLSVA